ncbi:MAG: hypothetical protein ACQKBV_04065 [Puniceicoccales bacterium]
MNACPDALIVRRARGGFSLFEVVLAVGVLAVSILALLGLFAPTMSSVRDVVDSNEASGVRTRLNAALMSDEIYSALGTSTSGTRFTDFAGRLSTPDANSPYLIYFWQTRDNTNDPLELNYSTSKGDVSSDLSRSEGQAFIVALEQGMQSSGADKFDFTNVQNEGYFPILVSIYALPVGELVNINELSFVNETEPVFTYTTAKLR